MAKHTWGMWGIERPPIASGFHRSIIAFREGEPDVLVAYVGSSAHEPETAYADAKMMVAAPAMLEALKAIINNGEFDSDGDFCIYRLEDKAYLDQPELIPPDKIVANAKAAIDRAEKEGPR